MVKNCFLCVIELVLLFIEKKNRKMIRWRNRRVIYYRRERRGGSCNNKIQGVLITMSGKIYMLSKIGGLDHGEKLLDMRVNGIIEM